MLVRALVPVLVCAHSAAGTDVGPVDVSAERFQYRRYDPATGVLLLEVRAREAVAAGAAVTMADVVLAQRRGGRVVLTVTSARGKLTEAGAVSLDGGVVMSWQGSSSRARFACDQIRADARSGSIVSDAAVWGVIERIGADGARAAGPTVHARGQGIAADGDGRKVEIRRNVVLDVAGVARGPWTVSSDRGLSVVSDETSTSVRLAGPVEARAPGLTWGADAAEVVLAGDDGDEAGFRRAFASGNVHADGTASGAPFAGSDAPARIEARALAAEVMPDGSVALAGTVAEPAWLAFDRGCLRGTRVEVGPGFVRSSGGATSVLTGSPR